MEEVFFNNPELLALIAKGTPSVQDVWSLSKVCRRFRRLFPNAVMEYVHALGNEEPYVFGERAHSTDFLLRYFAPFEPATQEQSYDATVPWIFRKVAPDQLHVLIRERALEVRDNRLYTADGTWLDVCLHMVAENVRHGVGVLNALAEEGLIVPHDKHCDYCTRYSVEESLALLHAFYAARAGALSRREATPL